MTCDKALRVVTDDGEQLLPCYRDDPVMKHRALDGTEWKPGHPAEVTVRRHRPVEPEQPRPLPPPPGVRATDVFPTVNVDPADMPPPLVPEPPIVAGEQPLDVEAWRRQAVKALNGYYVGPTPSVFEYRYPPEQLAETLLDAGLAGPVAAGWDEAEARAFIGRLLAGPPGDGTEPGIDEAEEAAERIVGWFKAAGPVAAPPPTIDRERLIADLIAMLRESPNWTFNAPFMANWFIEWVALLPSTDKDDNDE